MARGYRWLAVTSIAWQDSTNRKYRIHSVFCTQTLLVPGGGRQLQLSLLPLDQLKYWISTIQVV